MEYNAQAQDYQLDLNSFDLSDFVNASGQQLGDMFHNNPGSSQDGQHGQQRGPGGSGGAQRGPAQYNPHGQQSSGLPDGVSAQQVQQMLGMQMPMQQNMAPGQSNADLGLGPAITPAILKERLEAHMKIQQLQQLQAQILQHQIEMLRASHETTIRRDVPFQGLPTPAASSELLPTMQNDVLSMSPMVLQEMLMNAASSSNGDTMLSRMDMQHMHQLTMSAPPALAFQHTSPVPTDYELSPLTSPWLTGVPGVPTGPQQQSRSMGTPQQAAKRPRRNSDADEPESHKRRAAASRSGLLSGVVASASKRKSPPMRNVTTRRSSLANETLSAAMDAQMLPPPPKDLLSSGSSSASIETPHATSASPDIAPVTPGAIMGFGPMRPGLVPPTTESGRPRRSTTKPRPIAASTTNKKNGSMAPNTPRTILPSGGTPIIAAASHPPVQVRKSSHKVAEQKRRDSMKLSYDELRLLLPPIPVNLDDGERDEPLLPGAMPPRGPPRGDGDGPNRAVSKLALLRSGNEFIRELKWRMDRRDEEIVVLRSEVSRMRTMFEKLGVQDTVEPIDLDRDVDAGWEEERKARKAAARAAHGAEDSDDDE